MLKLLYFKLSVYILILSIIFLLAFSCAKDNDLLSLVDEIALSESSTDSLLIVTETDSISAVVESDSLLATVVTDSILITNPIDSLASTIPKVNTPTIYNRTTVSIVGNQFYINGKPTYEGRYWQGNKIEGLLMNSRMVQGIFDDSNSETAKLFAYADTNKWDPERNTNEFISHMNDWKNNGLLSFTLNLQGGSPTGYGNQQPWINSAFNEDGSLRPAYMNRLKRILDKADELQMVVILGYFYFGQDQILQNETAVLRGVDYVTNWILDHEYQNVIIEISNECDGAYDHNILGPNRVHELIDRVHGLQRNGLKLLVSTSYEGRVIPSTKVVQVSDFILLHGNGVENPSGIEAMVDQTKNVPGYTSQPIVFNEDDHFNFEAPNNNMVSAVKAYASWGYFDFRQQGESFEEGYQSVPVDWGINSNRKRSFFSKLKEITGN